MMVAADGDERAVARVGLAATHGDASVFFEFLEEVLDQVPPFVGVSVEVGREAAVGFGRDDRLKGYLPFGDLESRDRFGNPQTSTSPSWIDR
jgi:hypothetical protein